VASSSVRYYALQVTLIEEPEGDQPFVSLRSAVRLPPHCGSAAFVHLHTETGAVSDPLLTDFTTQYTCVTMWCSALLGLPFCFLERRPYLGHINLPAVNSLLPSLTCHALKAL
jgi:hypothetical protein